MSRWELLTSRVFLFSMGIMRRITLGVRGVLIDGNSVLLIRHRYISGWHFPGGGVEPDETVETSLQREVLEETGYELTAPAELKGVYLNKQATNRDHVLVYVCRDFNKVREREPDMEIAATGWFDRHDLPEGTTEATRRRIAEIFDSVPADSHW